MKTIELTQGKVALVDDSDFLELSKFKWFAMRGNGSRWCAGRNFQKKNGKRGTIYMHRQILGFPKLEVDHRDRNALNNQRSNLRLANETQQAANKTCRPNTSGFRGVKCVVGKWPLTKRFEARINERKKYRYLGHFETAIEAAVAYDRAAKRLFGEFAVLNFP